MKLLTQTSLRFVYIALAALFVCGASVVSAPRAQAYEGDDVFPRIIESASLVFSTIQDRVDADGAELLTQSTSVAQDPQIAALIALLNQLISQYQALLAAQGGGNTNTSSTPSTTNATSATGTISTTASVSAISVNSNVTFTLKGRANGSYVYIAIDGGAREKVTVTGGAWTKVVTGGLTAGQHTVSLYASLSASTALKSRIITVTGTAAESNPSTGTLGITSPNAGAVYKIGDTIRVSWNNQNACTYGFTMKWVHDRNDDKNWETGRDILFSSTESATIMNRGYYDFVIPSIYNSVAGTSAVYKNAIYIVCNANEYKALSGSFRVDLATGVQATKINKTDAELIKGVTNDGLGTISTNNGIYKAYYLPPSVVQDANDVWVMKVGESMDVSWELIGQRYVYLNLIQDTNSDGVYDSVYQITKYDTNYGLGHTQRNYTWTASASHVKNISSKIIVSKEPMTSVNINPAESVISGSKTFKITQ